MNEKNGKVFAATIHWNMAVRLLVASFPAVGCLRALEER